ncbi:MAG TPA: hypothetical protein VLE69_01525 [Candidatus Saccharimonadales bacterium]|nr:hypothetical protein [Candidatus Saccharimonadales bacterium]
MNVREFNRVFGSQPYKINPSEVIADIGSGYSDLSNLVHDGLVIQVDPLYAELDSSQLISPDNRVMRVPVALGSNDDLTRRALDLISGLKPDRVTMANALRYIPGNEKVRALEQMLFLGQGGITQLYPYRSSKSETVVEKGTKLGFNITAQKVSLGGLRQATYALGRINSTLTVEPQRKKTGPADRNKLAELIASHVL